MKKTVLLIDFDPDREQQIFFGTQDKLPETPEETEQMETENIRLLVTSLKVILEKSKKKYLVDDIVNFLKKDISDSPIITDSNE